MLPSSAPFVDAETPRSEELAAGAVNRRGELSHDRRRGAPGVYALPHWVTTDASYCLLGSAWILLDSLTHWRVRIFYGALLVRIRGLAPLTPVTRLGVAERLAGPVRFACPVHSDDLWLSPSPRRPNERYPRRRSEGQHLFGCYRALGEGYRQVTKTVLALGIRS
jgi:hypothetical protein